MDMNSTVAPCVPTSRSPSLAKSAADAADSAADAADSAAVAEVSAADAADSAIAVLGVRPAGKRLCFMRKMRAPTGAFFIRRIIRHI
jgi:hypothetical protein